MPHNNIKTYVKKNQERLSIANDYVHCIKVKTEFINDMAARAFNGGTYEDLLADLNTLWDINETTAEYTATYEKSIIESLAFSKAG